MSCVQLKKWAYYIEDTPLLSTTILSWLIITSQTYIRVFMAGSGYVCEWEYLIGMSLVQVVLSTVGAM
jgi:hypothetical protein